MLSVINILTSVTRVSRSAKSLYVYQHPFNIPNTFSHFTKYSHFLNHVPTTIPLLCSCFAKCLDFIQIAWICEMIGAYKHWLVRGRSDRFTFVWGWCRESMFVCMLILNCYSKTKKLWLNTEFSDGIIFVAFALFLYVLQTSSCLSDDIATFCQNLLFKLLILNNYIWLLAASNYFGIH